MRVGRPKRARGPDPAPQMMAHAASSTSHSEERVQQLLQLQLAQRQEVATLSSALQAAGIRVQTLETQLRTAQVLGAAS